MTAQDFYRERVRGLPPGERLKLAALILDELARAGAPVALDLSDGWTEQDREDLSLFSLGYAESLYPEP